MVKVRVVIEEMASKMDDKPALLLKTVGDDDKRNYKGYASLPVESLDGYRTGKIYELVLVDPDADVVA